jgi:hypothetical protein
MSFCSTNRPQLIKQELELSRNFRSGQIHSYEFGLTLLLPKTDLGVQQNNFCCQFVEHLSQNQVRPKQHNNQIHNDDCCEFGHTYSSS